MNACYNRHIKSFDNRLPRIHSTFNDASNGALDAGKGHRRAWGRATDLARRIVNGIDIAVMSIDLQLIYLNRSVQCAE